ncbi:MAG: class II aldolase/adducin family protein [Betaproteobacteria bacterium]|nr:class II aldolase/adducin family protein [Betaproteobacteria bacterium]MBM3383794.1 class II aldolase/adducin family protein [Betaproteobacteria bacterium]
MKREPVDSLQEQSIRVELAAAYRVAALLGWSELIYAHITARVPGPEHRFLINPYGLRWDEVTASNLVKIDVDGNVVGESRYGANKAGFVIHSAIHMGAKDANWVFHTHTLAGMAVSAQACGLLPIHMYAHNFYQALSYHDYEGPSMRLGERERIVASLGENSALMLRNHGLLTTGRTMPEAWIRMWRLERACQIQLAAQAGGKLVEPSPEMCRQSQALGNEFLTEAAPLGELEFASLRRLVDEKDSGYRS